MLFNPSYATDNHDWEEEVAFFDMDDLDLDNDQPPVNYILEYAQTIQAPGFPHIGIKGTTSVISEITSYLKLVTEDHNGPAYAMISQINEGKMFLKSTDFCMMIQCGDSNKIDFPDLYDNYRLGDHARMAGAGNMYLTLKPFVGDGIEFTPAGSLLHEAIHGWRGQMGYLYDNRADAIMGGFMEEFETVAIDDWTGDLRNHLYTEKMMGLYYGPVISTGIRMTYGGGDNSHILLGIRQLVRNPMVAIQNEDIIKQKALQYTVAAATSLFMAIQMYGL